MKLRRKAVDQFGVKEACKVAVESFVAADNSLLKLRPGTSLRFLSQNMEQKEPEKKMPLTVTNAIIHLAKLALVELHHLRAQLALRWMHGTILMASSRCSFSFGSLVYVSMKREYVLLWMFLIAIWKP